MPHKPDMVTRTRLGRIFQALVLYLGAAAIIGYFAFHAYHGNYGLNAKRVFEEEIAELIAERDALKSQRMELEHRVGLLAPDHLDPDLVEELARRDLGFSHPNDLVSILPRR